MWDLPGLGLEPVSPALAGGFLTTAPPGKPLMWTIFKVFTEFVTTLFLLYVLVPWPRGMWDPSSPTRDRTHTPCIGRRSPNHWTAREVPVSIFLVKVLHLFQLFLGRNCSHFFAILFIYFWLSSMSVWTCRTQDELWEFRWGLSSAKYSRTITCVALDMGVSSAFKGLAFQTAWMQHSEISIWAMGLGALWRSSSSLGGPSTVASETRVP